MIEIRFERIDAKESSTFCGTAGVSVATSLWAQLFGIAKSSWQSDTAATGLKSLSFHLLAISSNTVGGLTSEFRASSSRRVLASTRQRKAALIASSSVRHNIKHMYGIRPLHCPPAWRASSSRRSCCAFRIIPFSRWTSFFRNDISCWSTMGCTWSHCTHFARFQLAGLRCCWAWSWAVVAVVEDMMLLRRIISSAYSILDGLMSLFLIAFHGSVSISSTGVPPSSVRPKHIRNSCFLLLLLSKYVVSAFDTMLRSGSCSRSASQSRSSSDSSSSPCWRWLSLLMVKKQLYDEYVEIDVMTNVV